MKIPAIENAVNGSRKFQFTSVCVRPPIKEERQFIVIINNDVPIAFFIGNLKNRTNAGMIRNPPPAPTSPVSVPTIIPVKTIEV